MKKIFIITLLALSFNSFGQKLKFSVSSGVNTNFFGVVEETEKVSTSGTTGYVFVNYNSRDTEFESKPKLGFFIDGSLSYSFNNYFSVETGIGISSNPMKLISIDEITYADIEFGENDMIIENWVIRTDEYCKDIEFNNFLLNIPLCVNLELLNQRIIISAGTEISKVLSSYKHIKTDYETEILDFKKDLKSFIWNMKFGVKFKLYKRLFLGLDYKRSINKINKDNFFTYSTFDSEFIHKHTNLKLNTFSLNLTYYLN